MELEKYIQKIRPLIEAKFKEEYSGHDISHLERTMKMALYIQSKEGGDKIVIGISAFLHDIHRIMQCNLNRYVSPRDSLSEVESILNITGLNRNLKQRILHCIEFHEEYNWNNSLNKKENIETLILQDADNLDAMGAMGVARTFLYGGAYKILIYNDKIPLEINNKYIEDNGTKESLIHHFYHKLIKLDDNMNTETAKYISKKRLKFMMNYLDEFLEEWKGI